MQMWRPAAIVAVAMALLGCGRARPAPVAAPASPAALRVTAATPGPLAYPGQPAAASPISARTETPGRDELLIARGSALYIRDMRSARERRLFALANGRYVTDPAWSPAGDQFAYVENVPFVRTGDDWGSDLYVAGADGRTRRLLLRHAAPGAQLASPSWTPDGRAMVYADLQVVADPLSGAPVSRDDVRRVDVHSGAVTALFAGALDPVLCRDGSRIAYVEPDPDTNTRATLVVRDTPAAAGRSIVAGAMDLVSLYAPRFSPDCRTVVFAAVSGSAGCGLSSGRSAQCGPGASVVGHRVGFVHNSPWDLWIVGSDGSGLRRLTNLNEDMPVAAWSADGETVVFVGTGGLYATAPDGNGLRRIGEGAEHSHIAWFQGQTSPRPPD